MNSSEAFRVASVAVAASAQAMVPPIPAANARITLLARSVDTLIHSLLNAAGTARRSLLWVRAVESTATTVEMAGLVMVMVRIPSECRSDRMVGRSGGGELGGGAGHREQGVLEG